MSAEFQMGLGWSRPLLSMQSKYCLVFPLDSYFSSEAGITDIVI